MPATAAATACVGAALRGGGRLCGFVLSLGFIGAILILTSSAPLAPLTPLAEERLSEAFGGPVDISGLRLRSTKSAVELQFDRVQGSGEREFSALHGRASLTLGRLFDLRPMPRSIEIDRLVATVPTAQPGTSGVAPFPIERLLMALATGEAGDILLPSVSVVYLDDERSEVFRLRRGSFEATLGEGAYGIDARLPFVLADGTEVYADLDVSIARDGTASLAFVSGGAPIQPLLTAFGVDAFSVESSLNGAVELVVSAAGEPQRGTIDLLLAEGTGTIAGVDFELGENILQVTFAEGEPVFRIDALSYDIAGNRGDLTGTVGTQNLLDPVNLILDFDVAGSDIVVDLKQAMDAPVQINAMRAKGSFDAAGRRLAFADLRTTFFTSEAAGFLALTFPEGFHGSPRIQSDAMLRGPLTPQQVLAGWPRPLAREARQWVAENLREGVLTDLAYSSDIPMGAIREGVPLADESMLFTFRADAAKVQYLPDMPPVTGLSASAEVRGNSFSVNGTRGEVAGVRIEDARLSMPQFGPPGAEATFAATLRGEVPTILSALEQSGLFDPSAGGYASEAFHGQGSFDLSIAWPLVEFVPEDAIRISGEGAFVRGGIDNVLPGIDATDAGGRVSLTPRRLVVRGDGLAAQAPTTFEWRQELTGARQAQLAVSAELDTLAADMIGFPLRQFFRGEILTQIYAEVLEPGAPVTIIAELTDAAVSIPALGVSKPRGVQGIFETSVVLPRPDTGDGSPPENVTLNPLRLSSPSFNIEGAGTFTPEGGVVRLELPRLFIQDTADLSLRLITDKAGIHVDVDGEHASAVTALDSLFASGGPGIGTLPGTAEVELSLQRLSLKNNVSLRAVTAEGHHTGDALERFTLRARLGADGFLSVALDRPPGSELGFVEIEATDFGTLMNGMFGISSVSGAAGSIKGTTLPGEGFEGRFEMAELIVRDAPILARILSSTSLDGLVDALGGEGIRFSRLEGDIGVDGGLFTLSDAKLVGSSLGMSAAGEVDLDAGTIDVRGAFAPAYAVNGVLGALPGIGRLFVSREGEGLVAFSYSITGSLDQPIVTVNALSALTPGILRRLFDPQTSGVEALERATDAAERRRDLSEGP